MPKELIIMNADVDRFSDNALIAIYSRDMKEAEKWLCFMFSLVMRRDTIDYEGFDYLLLALNDRMTYYSNTFGDTTEVKCFVSVNGKWELR